MQMLVATGHQSCRVSSSDAFTTTAAHLLMSTEGVFDLVAAGEGLMDLHGGTTGVGKHPEVRSGQLLSSDKAGAGREVSLWGQVHHLTVLVQA